jgi:predicted nucleic acid-binding protein
MDGNNILAVLDAGPLIHLDELACLSFLDDFDAVLVPKAVLAEALKHRPGLPLHQLARVEIVSLSPPLGEELQRLADRFALHAGERSALAVLHARGGSFLLSDDAAARAVAQAVGFQTHGTIGIILRMFRRRRISRETMLALLHDLPARTSLHLRADFLNAIIAKATAESA